MDVRGSERRCLCTDLHEDVKGSTHKRVQASTILKKGEK